MGCLVVLLGFFYFFQTRQTTSTQEEEAQLQPTQLADPHLVRLETQAFEIDEPAYLIGDVVMVPMRELFESAGARVIFHPYREQAVAKFEDTEVAVRLNHRYALVDKEPFRLSRPSMVIEGSMYVPLSLAEEIL